MPSIGCSWLAPLVGVASSGWREGCPASIGVLGAAIGAGLEVAGLELDGAETEGGGVELFGVIEVGGVVEVGVATGLAGAGLVRMGVVAGLLGVFVDGVGFGAGLPSDPVAEFAGLVEGEF